MVKRNKNGIGAAMIFLMSVLFFLLAYKGCKKQNIDLATLDKITDTVEDRGTTYSTGKVKSLVFFAKFKNENQVLGVYRSSKKYNDLLEQLPVGSKCTAYFIGGRKQGSINMDLVQLEYNGQIILNKKEYEKKHRWLIYIGVCCGIFFAAMSYLQYKHR